MCIKNILVTKFLGGKFPLGMPTKIIEAFNFARKNAPLKKFLLRWEARSYNPMSAWNKKFFLFKANTNQIYFIFTISLANFIANKLQLINV